MKGMRCSVRTLGLAVLLIAVDCGFLRFVLLVGGPAQTMVALLGAFGMVNILALALGRLALDGGPGRPFLAGFLIAGAAGLCLLPALVEASQERLGGLLFWVGNEIPFVRDVLIQARRGKALSWPQSAAIFTLFVALLNAVMTPPLLFFAYLGGSLSRLVHRGFLRSVAGRESVLP